MLLIDAYNVLHVTGVLPPDLAGLDVPGLVRLLGESRYARRRTTLVCDGGGSRSSGVRMGHVDLLFSGSMREADDLIEQLIDRYGHGGGLEVVSNDRRLVRAARKRRAHVVRSETLLRQLVADHRRLRAPGPPVFATAIPLDPMSVAVWLREFGVEDDATPSSGEAVRVAQPPLPPPPAEVAATPRVEPVRAEPRAAVELDPLLRAALEEWRGRLTVDDLDMQRWLDGKQIDIRDKYDG